MRYQAQGHIRSRLSTWGLYVYCRSHLLNLSVEDAIENSVYDAYDTVHSTLVFLRDSPHRLQVLFKSQKIVDSNKKGKIFTNIVLIVVLTSHFINFFIRTNYSKSK